MYFLSFIVKLSQFSFVYSTLTFRSLRGSNIVLIVYNSVWEAFELKLRSSSSSLSGFERGDGILSTDERLMSPGYCDDVGAEDKTE